MQQEEALQRGALPQQLLGNACVGAQWGREGGNSGGVWQKSIASMQSRALRQGLDLLAGPRHSAMPRAQPQRTWMLPFNPAIGISRHHSDDDEPAAGRQRVHCNVKHVAAN